MKILPSEIMDRLTGRLARLYGESRAPSLMDRLGLLAGRYGVEGRAADRPLASYWSQRDALLITYGDMVLGTDEQPLVTLRRFLERRLQGAVSTVHILPFLPYSSDEGFSVVDYRQVNAALGTWEDVSAIGEHFDLMFDLVLNHVSAQSNWFAQYINGIAPARDYFIEVEAGTDLSEVVRPRTSPLLTPVYTNRGERLVWTTFSADQVDLNFANPDVLFEFLDILLLYVHNGARIVRLDAIAYLWKRVGTASIHLPETHEVVGLMRDVLDLFAPGVLLLTETNVPHEENISYFGAGDEAHVVYQFSLPPLLLHALHSGTTRYLTEWAAALPPPPPGCTFLNFTASHDGIGMRPLEGLVPESEINEMVEAIRQRGGRVSMRGKPDGTESPYELNVTYFDALADPGETPTSLDIDRFICSQVVPLALQGIPAIYFHSLMATRNDHSGVERTGEARAINRMRWQEQQLDQLLDDPATPTARVFQQYLQLLKLRARHAAFHPDGAQQILSLEDGLFGILRTAPDESERLIAVSNCGATDRALPLREVLTHLGSANSYRDLISGVQSAVGPDQVLPLAPYQTLWLVDAENPAEENS